MSYHSSTPDVGGVIFSLSGSNANKTVEDTTHCFIVSTTAAAPTFFYSAESR